MEFTAEMIAGLLQGEVVGDKNAKVHTVGSIEEGKEGALAYLMNPKYEQHIYTTKASIVLVGKDFEPKEAVAATMILDTLCNTREVDTIHIGINVDCTALVVIDMV